MAVIVSNDGKNVDLGGKGHQHRFNIDLPPDLDITEIKSGNMTLNKGIVTFVKCSYCEEKVCITVNFISNVKGDERNTRTSK